MCRRDDEFYEHECELIKKFTKCDYYRHIHSSLFLVDIDGKQGVFDLAKLKYLIPPEYDHVGHLKGDIYIVMLNDVLSIVNTYTQALVLSITVVLGNPNRQALHLKQVKNSFQKAISASKRDINMMHMQFRDIVHIHKDFDLFLVREKCSKDIGQGVFDAAKQELIVPTLFDYVIFISPTEFIVHADNRHGRFFTKTKNLIWL